MGSWVLGPGSRLLQLGEDFELFFPSQKKIVEKYFENRPRINRSGTQEGGPSWLWRVLCSAREDRPRAARPPNSDSGGRRRASSALRGGGERLAISAREIVCCIVDPQYTLWWLARPNRDARWLRNAHFRDVLHLQVRNALIRKATLGSAKLLFPGPTHGAPVARCGAPSPAAPLTHAPRGRPSTRSSTQTPTP